MCIPRDAFVHPKKGSETHGQKSDFHVRREKIFSRTTKRFQRGPLTQFLVILWTPFWRSRVCAREIHAQTDRQRDRSLETSDRAGRFSLSFCIIKVRARVNNRSRRKHINGRERFHLPFEKRYKKISPPNVRRVKAPRKEKIFLESNHGCRRPTERAVEPKRRTK